MRRVVFPIAASFAAASLVTTLFIGFMAKSRYDEASAWVEHTSEVRLALSTARLHLDDARIDALRGDPTAASIDALARDVALVQRLTADNGRQQSRFQRMTDAIGRMRESKEGAPLDDALARATLAEMDAEETVLMTSRAEEQRAANRVRSIGLSSAAALTTALCLVALYVLMRQRRALAESDALMQSVLEGMGDGVLAVDKSWRFLFVNDAARKIFSNAEPGELVSKRWAQLHDSRFEDGNSVPTEGGAIGRALRGEATDGLRFSVRRPGENRTIWVRATGRPVRDASGAIVAAVAVYHDITLEKLRTEKLEAESTRDELTGLYNRRGFLALAELRAGAGAEAGRPYAVLFADLNGLKKINDTLGHDVGDRAIKQAADVIARTVRGSDVAARLGGDEFVIFLDGADIEIAREVESRLRNEMQLDEARVERSFRLSMSIGAACSSATSPRSVANLVNQADKIMYERKRGARSSQSLLKAVR